MGSKRVLVRAAVVAGTRGEGTEVEDARDERPEVRDVGDDDGGAGFANVPV